MILDYNATKGGVDTADQMLQTYTCKRMTRRWPTAIFYNIIDISALNAFIIWISLNTDYEPQSKHRRRVFLQQLGKELIGVADIEEHLHSSLLNLVRMRTKEHVVHYVHAKKIKRAA